MTTSKCLAITLAIGICIGSSRLPLCAQSAPTSLVVPSQYTTQEAPNAVFWAISPFAARRQLILGATHLRAAKGRKLKGLRVRRNGGERDTLSAGFLQLEVSLSETAHSLPSTSPTFAQNRGKSPVVVFKGVVSLPTSPAPRVMPAAWTSQFQVKLPFAASFVYGGRNLCVETVTSLLQTPSGGVAQHPWWPLDGLRQSSFGAVKVRGQSCIPGLPGHPAGADAASQNLGASAVVFLRGSRAQGSGLVLVGYDNKTLGGTRLPLDLAVIGAPTCSLYLDPILAAQFTLKKQPGGLGHVAMTMPVPYDVGLAGLSYYTQWMLSDPGHNSAGLTFSNGVQATIGPHAPPLGISWIESTDLNAAAGRILTGRTPVLRFDL